ncbi:pyridoxal phosphate-dependent aminotransferase [soil metagenome]
MDQVSSRIANLTPSLTLAITSQAKALQAAGKEVYSFGAGEPDMDTPAFIKQAAIDALDGGETKYTASAGLPALRKAIAEKLAADNGIEYDISQISVNCGAKHSLFNAILATCEEDDEVVIPSPYWTSYPEMVKMAGATPVFVQTTEANRWKMTAEQFEEAMSPRTKMIILNSPSNPTGAIYSREELEAIGEVAASEDIIILSDEIYEKLVYDGAEHVSIGSLSDELRDLTITVNGFSKAYSMTGWRLGYTAAPEPIAHAIDTIQSHSTSNPTTFAQYGGLAAIKGDQQVVSDMRDEFDVRRQYMLSRFTGIDNVTVAEPRGAFYFLVNCQQMGLQSINLAEKLLSRYQVAVIPGIAFGNDSTLRFSYACSLENIKNGLDRFEEFCKSH